MPIAASEPMTHRPAPAGLACALGLVLLLNAAGAPARAACAGSAWVAAWTAAPSNAGATLFDSGAGAFTAQTLRLNVTPLRSGHGARIRLSNRFGTQLVVFDRVFVGRQDTGARLVVGSNRPVRFDGRTSVTVAPGDEAVSDPIPAAVRAFRHLTVSLWIAGATGPATLHAQAHQTSFFTPTGAGDRSAQESDDGFTLSTDGLPFLVGIETRAPRRDGVLVAVGDSITDGDQRSPAGDPLGVDTDTRYPDLLAHRLRGRRRHFAVLNEGIGGNRILGQIDHGPLAFAGPSLLSRLDADVIGQRRVTDVLLLEGINDLGLPAAPAGAVIQGLQDAVDRLHAVRTGGRRRLNVLVGTIMPNGGDASVYASPGEDARRRQVNDYIRTHGIGDGVVDFDRALRDPGDPSRLASPYDSGDGLHPSSAGYQRMADEVDPSALKGPECGRR